MAHPFRCEQPLRFVLFMRHPIPVFTNFFQDQTLPPSSFSISHSPIPDSIISPRLSLTPETMVLDIGKHTFNYPWPHISLKYLHCTTPQGDTVHDLSPNLFMGPSLMQRLIASVTAICIYSVAKSWNTLVVMFATRHGCQIEVFSHKDVACFCGLDVPAVGFFHFYPRTHTQEGTQ